MWFQKLWPFKKREPVVFRRFSKLDENQKRFFDRTQLYIEACDVFGRKPTDEEWAGWVSVSLGYKVNEWSGN